jgi:drug/metabolite transporter (DMT)-like permease
MTLTRRQVLLLVALTRIWGINWLMMKYSLREVPRANDWIARLFIATAIVTAIAAATGLGSDNRAR